MRNQRTIAALSLAFALMMPLAACGGSASGGTESKQSDEAYYTTGSSSEEVAYDGGYAAEEAEAEAAPAAAEAALVGSTVDLTTTSIPAAEGTQKLVYSASVSVDTTDYAGTVAALRDLMGQTGAFAEYEDEWVWGGDGLHVLEVSIRVPAESYDALMTGIDGIGGTVTNRTSQVTNITRTYADNEAIIEGLQIQEQRLLEMMGQAETVEEMLLVEERLSEVQTQLNRARTSRETMDADVSLSTVNVRINEVRIETTTGGTGYGTRVVRAFADMWDGFVEGVGDFFIGLIYAIPGIVILAVLAFGGSRVVRGIRNRRAARNGAGQPPAAPVAPAAPVTPAAPADAAGTTDGTETE